MSFFLFIACQRFFGVKNFLIFLFSLLLIIFFQASYIHNYHDLLNQINVEGRILYIEKLNDELSKAYRVTKYKNNYSKDFLFDVFSNFYLTKKTESFNF